VALLLTMGAAAIWDHRDQVLRGRGWRQLSYIEELRESAGPKLTEGITPKQYEAAAAMIRFHGFDCPRAELMVRYAFNEGFSVYCDGGRYRFELENHGGQWSVTPP